MLEDIEERIRKIICKQLETDFSPEEIDIKPEEINFQVEIESYNLTSISFIKFLIALEKEFQIKFDDRDLDIRKYRTLNDIVAYISSKLV